MFFYVQSKSVLYLRKSKQILLSVSSFLKGAFCIAAKKREFNMEISSKHSRLWRSQNFKSFEKNF